MTPGQLAAPRNWSRGEDRWSAKLTEDDVRVIRICTDTGAALARKFGVSEAAISMIRSRKRWGHVL